MLFYIPFALGLLATVVGVANHYLLQDTLVERCSMWVALFCLGFMLMSVGYYAAENFWGM